MFHVLLPLVMLATVTPPAGQDVGAGPQPSPTPVSWEFELTFLDPQRLEIKLPGTERTEVYWYMVYTVTNTTRRSERFFPTFQIVTEDFRVVDTDMGISPLVFDAIAERHKITHKYLVPPTKAIGALLSGDDNARESVAIWRGVDLSRNRFTIYVAGLSGEARVLRNPTFNAQKPEKEQVIGTDGRPQEIVVNPRSFTLRKTLEIRYNLAGSEKARAAADPERGEVRWVMR